MATTARPNGAPAAAAAPPPTSPEDARHGHTRGRRSISGPDAGLSKREASADRSMSTKTKQNLALVPCKFFRQSTCSAGDSCPFSHTLPEPGQGKTICQWYLKGSCKFGHKCALAHVLPGEPMSQDRKNKRAQQLAQREAAAAVNGAAPAEPPHSPPAKQQSTSGMTRVFDTMAAEAHLRNEPPRSPPLRREGSASHARPGYDSGAVTFASVVGNHQQWPVVGQSSRAAGTPTSPVKPLASPSLSRPMLLEQAGRRPSQGSFHNGSPPVFGTSPFAAPGSNSVFFSGSYPGSDEGENGFGGAAARRTSPVRKNGFNPNLGPKEDDSDSEAVSVGDDDDEDPLAGSRHEEDCLPSSLSDLLTPDEIRRRQRKLLAGPTPEAQLSRSVPHAPPLPSPSGSTPSSITTPPLLPPASSSSNGMPSFAAQPPPSLAGRSLLANHPPGSSLPPGLAAGLSRLHFLPARHTGETPPPSQGASPVPPILVSTTAGSMRGVTVGSPLARGGWQGPGSHTTSPRMTTLGPASTAGQGRSSFDGGEQHPPPEDMPFEMDY